MENNERTTQAPVTISEAKHYREVQKKTNQRSLASEKYGFTLNERQKLKRLFLSSSSSAASSTTLPSKRGRDEQNETPNFVKAVLTGDGQDDDGAIYEDGDGNDATGIPRLFNAVRIAKGVTDGQTISGVFV